MKVRQGFVSNSSSSSFVCCISGAEVSGMDMCMSEAGMYECSHGHMMCESYMENFAKQLAAKGLATLRAALATGEDSDLTQFNDIVDAMCNENDMSEDELSGDELYECLMDMDEIRYEFPSGLCPVCQLEVVLDGDVLRYLLKKMGRESDDVREEIKGAYGDTPQDFYGYVAK